VSKGTHMKRLTVTLFLMMGLSLLLAVSGCVDIQVGGDAYDRGDYETALKVFLPFAEQRDAPAQFRLGMVSIFVERHLTTVGGAASIPN